MEFEKPTPGSPPRNKKEAIEDTIFTLLFEFWWLPFVIVGIIVAIKNS